LNVIHVQSRLVAKPTDHLEITAEDIKRRKDLLEFGADDIARPVLHPSASVRPRSKSLISRGGTVGYRLPPLVASTVPLQSGDTIILATDGIRADFADQLPRHGPLPNMADQILADVGKDSDDALVVVLRRMDRTP